MSDVVKHNPDAPEGFFESEAAGLRWLADAEAGGGARSVRVHRVQPGRIELGRVHTGRADAEAAGRFGAALSRTHDAGAAAFGAPPDGWSGPIFIGRRRQAVAHEASWGRFYARDRVLPFVRAAVRAGGLGTSDAALVERACEPIADGFFDDDEPSARLHGDLWNGNVLWSPDGAVLIDPAAHGGHRETDLAMLDLFGCPHLDSILDGYQSARRLRDGWRDRIPLHQLHPLAVHAAGHGPSYGVALAAAARRTLALT